MVLEKCHFDDFFKKTIEQIEETFDQEFEDGFPLSLEGLNSFELRNVLQGNTLRICEGVWDKDKDPDNHNKVLYERLILEQIIFMLYMLKDSMEEKK